MIRKDNQCLYLIMRNYYFLLFLFLFYSTYASAEYYYDVEIDGVYYKVNQSTKEATVVMGCTEYTVGADSNYHPVKKICYSGNVVIPETISYNGEDYSVTHIQGRHDTRTSERPTIYGAFEDCSELISISIPKTIKEIGFKAFNGCTSLRSVYITNLSAWCGIDFELEGLSYSYSATGNPLYYAPKLYLGDELLENLIIPDDITTLKEGVFIGCNMKSVTLNKYVTGLGYDVFYNCQNLKDVYSYSPQVTVVPYSYFVANEGTFPDAQNMTLHIRERYKDNYIGTEGAALSVWNKFGKIEYISGVDFNLNYVVDGKDYKSIIMEVGESITPEAEPTKEGYIFSGWSEIPETMPDHDVTVTGTFTPNVYKLTYMVDEKEYKVCELKCDSVITPELEPARKGMAFSGWSEIPEKMPAMDVTVRGTFSWSKLTKDKVIYEVADTLQNYCKVIGNYNASGEIKIDSVEIDGCYYYPTEIIDKAFYGCKDMTSLEIPKTVTTIGERVFANIDKLTDVTCWAEEVATTDRTAFENSYIEDYVTLYVPASALENYKTTAPWKNFKQIVAIGGTEPLEKCSVPTIDYRDGKLVVNCDTEGAEYVTTITSDDFGEHQSNEIDITATYNISTFAKAEGYANSDVVTATLCWIELEEPETKINEHIESHAALIQSYGGTIKVSGNGLGGVIEVYNITGQLVGSENAVNGITTIITNLKAGDIAFVKIGRKTVKILLR